MAHCRPMKAQSFLPLFSHCFLAVSAQFFDGWDISFPCFFSLLHYKEEAGPERDIFCALTSSFFAFYRCFGYFFLLALAYTTPLFLPLVSHSLQTLPPMLTHKTFPLSFLLQFPSCRSTIRTISPVGCCVGALHFSPRPPRPRKKNFFSQVLLRAAGGGIF